MFAYIVARMSYRQNTVPYNGVCLPLTPIGQQFFIQSTDVPYKIIIIMDYFTM